VGVRADPQRTICATHDPVPIAGEHLVACHFAAVNLTAKPSTP
jgi:hypothetical protein